MENISILWNKAEQFYNWYVSKYGKPPSRYELKKKLKISENRARELLFALKYKAYLISSSNYDIEKEQVELVLADLHIPYEDKIALSSIFSYLEDEKIKPDIIVLLGDVIDFYKLSKFTKMQPQRPGIKYEISKVRDFLKFLRDKFPDSKIVYLYGNHCERLARYLIERAVEVYEIAENLYEDLLKVNELKIEVKTSFFKIGKLWHFHGHERKGTYNPEYITNVMWKYIHDNFICGHYHRNQTKTFKKITGEVYFGACVGHLALEGNTGLDYMPLNNWSQGFALVYYDRYGNFKCEVKNIVNGNIF